MVVVVVRRECDMAELPRVVEFFFGKVSGSYLSEFPYKEMSEWGSARPVVIVSLLSLLLSCRRRCHRVAVVVIVSSSSLSSWLGLTVGIDPGGIHQGFDNDDGGGWWWWEWKEVVGRNV